MKYIIYSILLLLYLIAEVVVIGTIYIFRIVWNFRFPKDNIWYEYHHNRISSLNSQRIEDENPWQTFLRRYNYFTASEI